MFPGKLRACVVVDCLDTLGVMLEIVLMFGVTRETSSMRSMSDFRIQVDGFGDGRLQSGNKAGD